MPEELLQRLKTLRARIARERGVPAYVIFADRTLIDMAAKRPLTRWDFGELHGVGESKLQQFAEVFLAEIRAFVQAARERDINHAAVSRRRPGSSFLYSNAVAKRDPGLRRDDGQCK